MVVPYQRARCVLLCSVCLSAEIIALSVFSGFRVYTALAGGLAAALVAVICLWWRLRDMRRELDRASRAKSQFLANVSHELRTPLNGIHGLAELLAADCDEAERRHMAAAIQASSESLMNTVDQILDYARIEKAEMRIDQTPLDVRAAVQDVADLAARKAAAKRLKFETVVEPEVPRVILGDPLRLRDVLRHLLDNAVKFTASGSVRLEVSVGGDRVDCRALLFRVRDTGPGVNPDLAARFFSAFTQADGASTREQSGLGLGLALAHRIVGLMGGSIGVESQPGQGSVFWFLVPTIAVEPPPSEDTGPVESRHGRVLVVDDNPINQLVAVRAVHSLGYAADAVAGGQSALEQLAQANYDAVIMDCQMPGMGGFQAAVEIRLREVRSGGHIPIIAMTANGPGSDREQCLAAGMDDYLAKPFRINDLDRALRRWVGGRARASKAG
jgi:signal transduction histidine kinase/ActR/RegA family two-component response regulator